MTLVTKRKGKDSNAKKKPIKSYEMDTITSRSRTRDFENHNTNSGTIKKQRARSQSPGRAMASLSLLKSTMKVQDVLSNN